MLADICVKSVRRVAYELAAVAISKPMTRAVIVPDQSYQQLQDIL